MVGPGGRGGWWYGSGGAIRQPAHWELGREETIGILFGVKKEGKRSKFPVLATVGSTAVIFLDNPLKDKWERLSTI